MEISLQSVSTRCYVSGREFVEGDRVVSFLVSGVSSEPDGAGKKALEALGRFDVLESEQGGFATCGRVVCRWVRVFKPRKIGENLDRALKMTAESLFFALSDPEAERTLENERMLQVLALMLERKRVLRPRGRNADGSRLVYEHARLKTLHEVSAAELSPEFFLSIQEQLAALVGGGGSGGAARGKLADPMVATGEANRDHVSVSSAMGDAS